MLKHYVVGRVGVCRLSPSELPAAAEDTRWHAPNILGRTWDTAQMGGTKAEATRRLEYGWEAGAEAVAALGEKITAEIERPVNVKRRQVWKDDGSDMSIDRALRGEWDVAFRGAVQSPRLSSTVVRVIAHNVFAGCLTADQIRWSGVAALAAVDALEREGWQVELVAATGNEEPRAGRACCLVDLKEAGEPMNVSSLAAALSPATYRWFVIPVVAMVAPFGAWVPGYGFCLPADEARQMAERLGELDKDTPTVCMKQVTTEAAAVAEANRVVSRVTALAMGAA